MLVLRALSDVCGSVASFAGIPRHNPINQTIILRTTGFHNRLFEVLRISLTPPDAASGARLHGTTERPSAFLQP
jgi:hypothetical protein